MVVKVKTWIEDDNEHLVFGGGKTQILELIDETGSISEASKRVGMNYKKAWSHIKILQEYIEDDLVVVKKGRDSGGTALTPKAKELILKYKLLEKEVRDFSTKRFEEIFMADGETINCTKESQSV
ncbi:LysR family transcriptional regulator [Candidatus Sulfurimonas marisnigri]|uniref:LysR family transcriptional regulator n=1 Tax=Candidatus Sulfurimonas marisnigri TaxID=2740405 RepID=A0A7S7LYF6_9BACT|nr:LysR family transcriptional regulator [Candidatus Sulfurimonas marisnigri]QOY53692.1 LysR family transcriptional regulator [Candidatus Sulfurimonas marisnigri]